MYTYMVMEEKDLVKENNGPSKFYLKHLNDPAQDKLSPPEPSKCNLKVASHFKLWKEKENDIGQFSD